MNRRSQGHYSNQDAKDKTSVSEPPISLKDKTSDSVSHRSGSLSLGQRLNQGAKEELGIGSILKDRFILEEILGQGGMGMVYMARDFRKEETHDREPYVAIKVLAKEFQEHPKSIIALQREAKKAQKLAHPNIITVYDFDRDGDNVFMTMEFLEGEPLNQIIQKARLQPLEQNKAISIIIQMSRALAYAHTHGIVHSDFKPGNVFVTKSDTVKVLDFGIARAAKLPEQQGVDETVFDAGTLGALTPVYASKEMLIGDDPDPRDDIYGLAVVAWQLLTGHHPFNKLPATNAQVANLKPTGIERLPRSIRKALVHALAFEREERTADAGQFLQEIIFKRRQKKSLKQRLFEIAALSVLTLLVISSAYFFISVEEQPREQKIILEETNAIADPEARQKVETLLETAEIHFLVGRLVEPPGSSALDAYRQVLESHNNNKQAHEGVAKIADHYEKVARKSLAMGDKVKAGEMVKKGLMVVPSHIGLEDLKSQLAQ